MRRYVINSAGEPVRECDLRAWAKWFETHFKERQVAEDQIRNCEVSTVFLGLDHNFSEDDPPIIWETMIFGGAYSHQCEHCSGTREQALAMHQAMVERVAALLALDESTNTPNSVAK